MGEAIELVVRGERRRRWRVEDKLRVVAETEAPGATVREVARRHDLNANLLYTWRRMAEGRPARPAVGAQLVPVTLAERPSGGYIDECVGIHEAQHSIQLEAVGGPSVWWDRWLKDIHFRAQQELESYGHQFPVPQVLRAECRPQQAGARAAPDWLLTLPPCNTAAW